MPPFGLSFEVREGLGRIIDPDFRKVIAGRISCKEISVFGAHGRYRGDVVMGVVFILPLVIHDDCNDNFNGEKLGG